MIIGGCILLPGKFEAGAKEQRATLSGTVDAGQRHVTHLRNLPGGSRLAVEAIMDGTMQILILDEAQFASLPGRVRPTFIAAGERQIDFDMTIPYAGAYYLIVFNHEGNTHKTFTMTITASVNPPGNDKAEETGSTPSQLRTLRELEEFQANLSQTFVFENLLFEITSCAAATTSDAKRVIVCQEVGQLALERLGDASRAGDVVLFIMMREIGRALLQQWQFPAANSEESIDQFTIVLYMIYGQTPRLNSLLEFLDTSGPGEKAPFSGLDASPKRMENLRQWIGDVDLARQWQPFLVRHIKTSTLSVLVRHPREWTDIQAIRDELERR